MTHARTIIEKSNELTAMHQTEKVKQARELQARKLELEFSEETVLALKSESAALGSQIEVERVSTFLPYCGDLDRP
jgi:hypothetical protein